MTALLTTAALLDCARLLPFDDAVVLADQAARFGVDPDRLRRRLPEWSGRRGVRRAGAVLGTMDVRSESVAETLTRILILRSHLPMPELQWAIPGRSRVYRADFAWPEHRVVAEFDGRGKHSADPARTAEQILAERRRETETQERGWTVLRLYWDHLEQRPDQVVARLHRALPGDGRLWPATGRPAARARNPPTGQNGAVPPRKRSVERHRCGGSPGTAAAEGR